MHSERALPLKALEGMGDVRLCAPETGCQVLSIITKS